MELTPTQAHYLKKELITLQLQKELEGLKKQPKLEELFSRQDTHYPFLRYLFQAFVTEFPLLKKQGQDEFWNKCQAFLDEFRTLKLDTYVPKNKAASQRRILMFKLEKMLVIALSASIKATQDEKYQPQSAAALNKSDHLTDGLEKLDIAKETSLTRYENEDAYLQWMNQGLDINVVGVRDIVEKRTLREKVHAEFLVRTVINENTTHFVAHRHGDFRQLHDDLQAQFPTVEIPPVPSKAKDFNFFSTQQQPNAETAAEGVYREKDRILLRVYLHEIASNARLAKSEIFERFLTANPIQLTTKEEEDVKFRLKMDRVRMDVERQFREKVDAQMDQLNGLLAMLKEQVVRPGGLLEIFAIIKATDNIQDLPDSLRKAFEWGRINFAFVLHTQFLTSDRAVENTANLKRTHSLMPYRTIAQILKVSNPFVMVKGILDLFLAQPFGGRSLFQRIILVNMHDQAKELQKAIDELEKQIGDPSLCAKIKNATETALPEGTRLGVDTPIAETLAILRNEDIQPALTAEQIKKVAFAHQSKESKQLIQRLYQLWKLYGREREQEMMMTLVFQGVTGELIKDLFAIFYQPLAQVYKSANIADSINDLSAFLGDLIQLLDSLDTTNLSNTAQPFVDLVQRHEQKFYRFVHDVHAHDTTHLFDDLLRYVDQVSSFAIHGLRQQQEPLDLSSLIEASPVMPDQYDALLKEIDQVAAYHQQRKALHLLRQKEKLLQTMEGEALATEDILAFLPENASGLAPLLHDMAELDMDDDYEDDEEDDDDYEDENEKKQGDNVNPSRHQRTKLAHELLLTPPTLTVLPNLVPFFADQVTYMMESHGKTN